MFRQLALSFGAILILMSSFILPGCSLQNEQGGDYESNNIVVFSNPPESQRFKGDYGPSVAAQSVIELDHYLVGYKSDNPRLHIEYTNISNGEVKIDIGIMWLVARDDIVRQVGQHDIRPPISPGQSERLTYRPVVESPSEIVSYSIVVHSLYDEQLPHVVFGPQIGPEDVKRTPTQTITVEIANLRRPELIELRRVIGDVLNRTRITANEDEKRLLSQAEIVIDVIKPNVDVRDLVRDKTEEERLVLDMLSGAFAAGLQYWAKVFYNIDVPSPIGGAIAKGAEELGNRIAEWLWLGEVSLAKVTYSDVGTMDIVYEPGVIWVSVYVCNPAGQIYMYIPVEPALASSEGSGNVVLSKGVRSIMGNCKICYRFSKVSAE